MTGGPISAKRDRFVLEYCLDQNGTQAAIRAGYAPGSAYTTASRLLRNAQVRAALAERRAEIGEKLDLDRQKVIGQILEAIDMARVQADPATMLKGWAEIAKMLGFYEPERKKIDVSVSAKRLVDQFEAMSDAELLRIVEQPARRETHASEHAFA